MWFISLQNLRWSKLVQCSWSYSIHKNLSVQHEFVEQPEQPMTMLLNIYMPRRFQSLQSSEWQTDGRKDRLREGLVEGRLEGSMDRQTYLILLSFLQSSRRVRTITHRWEHRVKWMRIVTIMNVNIFTPQPLRAPGYCRRPSGRAGGRADKPH